MFSEKDGFPREPFPNGWKGENGLYAVGFTKRGLLGASIDARRIAEDIELRWKAKKFHDLCSCVTPTATIMGWK
uniref:Uncharacterized protein n=1 Tax=Rhizophora mucronata TaxID=61149 RepID=A0A2P2QZP3_RHIMU